MRPGSSGVCHGHPALTVASRPRGLGDAGLVAKRLIADLEEPYVVNGDDATLTPSLGIAVSVQDRFGATDLLRQANVARDYAQRNPQDGRHALYEPSMELPEPAAQEPELILDEDEVAAPEALPVAELESYGDEPEVAGVTPAAPSVEAWFMPLIERISSLEREISVVLARADDGEIAVFPVAENRHAHGILDVSIAPARIPPALAAQAAALASRLATELEYVGVLALEMFVVGGELLLNEIAPRPHNSGHYTIDACRTSQFEQQVRVLCGLPLADPSQHTPAVMVNLLGDIWRQGEPHWEAVLRHAGAHLHLYGKREARPRRKMGHVTVCEAAPERALEVAFAIRRDLGIGESG